MSQPQANRVDLAFTFFRSTCMCANLDGHQWSNRQSPVNEGGHDSLTTVRSSGQGGVSTDALSTYPNLIFLLCYGWPEPQPAYAYLAPCNQPQCRRASLIATFAWQPPLRLRVTGLPTAGERENSRRHITICIHTNKNQLRFIHAPISTGSKALKTAHRVAQLL